MTEMKVNSKLFNEWKRLGHRIGLLKSVAQNDMQVSQEDIDGWFEMADDLYDKFYALIESTANHYEIKRSPDQLNKRSPLNR